MTSDKVEKGDGYAIDFEPSMYNPRVVKILGSRSNRQNNGTENPVCYLVIFQEHLTWVLT